METRPYNFFFDFFLHIWYNSNTYNYLINIIEGEEKDVRIKRNQETL